MCKRYKIRSKPQIINAIQPAIFQTSQFFHLSGLDAFSAGAVVWQDAPAFPKRLNHSFSSISVVLS
jgi:hypothetical protein